MLIRNFGHFWDRKYINSGTGGQGNRGHLKGYIHGNLEADFRDQIGIYVLYDKDFVPIYVGQAGRGQQGLWSRLKHHQKDHLRNRWAYFSWFGFRKVNKNRKLYADDDVEKIFRVKGSLLLNEVEGALITALEPKLNKQGARWKDVEEYYQTIDEELEEPTVGDLADRFGDFEKMLKKISLPSKQKA